LTNITACFAWALIPNHFHLLVRTGNVAVSRVMQRLLTGYAVTFNRHHNRQGHLFQKVFIASIEKDRIDE
jgi:putative transposase